LKYNSKEEQAVKGNIAHLSRMTCPPALVRRATELAGKWKKKYGHEKRRTTDKK